MKKVQNKNNAHKLYWLVSLCFAAAYSAYCFAILPLYFSLDANVDFADGILPDLVGYLGVAVENIAIFVFYGVVIYGIYRYGYRALRGMYAVFCAATVYKYLTNVIMSWVRENVVPATWGWDLFNVVYYTAFEMVMLWIIVAAVRRITARERGQKITVGGLYDKSNCLMRSAMACSIVTAGVKVFGNLVNDIALLVGYGSEGYLEMLPGVILNYVSALILGVICYAVSAYASLQLFSKCSEKDLSTAE